MNGIDNSFESERGGGNKRVSKINEILDFRRNGNKIFIIHSLPFLIRYLYMSFNYLIKS
jgi:hypothetical protein